MVQTKGQTSRPATLWCPKRRDAKDAPRYRGRDRAMWNPAAAYGDPAALDIDYVAGKSACDLPDWLGTSHARTGQLIASAETLSRDVKGQAATRSPRFTSGETTR